MPSLSVSILNKRVSPFHLFGALGFLAGTALGIFLAVHEALSPSVIILLSLLGAAQLFAQTWVQKVITGEENIVYYRHEIAILALSALILWIVGQPVTKYLDITLLGVGLFMAFGRIGCYNAGCCHGRPCRAGVRYTQRHAEEGFPWYYVGVRIFPVQLAESFFVFFTVSAGVWILLSGQPAGTVLVWYTTFYGLVRFILEFFRGDPERPYWQGLSEAQWTTLGLATLTLFCSMAGVLPLFLWQIALWGLISAACLVIVFLHKKWMRYRLLNPGHLGQVLRNIRDLERADRAADTPPQVRTTSLGLRCSCGTIHKKEGDFRHYTFSSQHSTLQLDGNALQGLEFYLRATKHYERKGEIITRENGIFHITFRQPSAVESAFLSHPQAL